MDLSSRLAVPASAIAFIIMPAQFVYGVLYLHGMLPPAFN